VFISCQTLHERIVAVKPKVIVADDHRLVAEGVVKILEKAYSVVATPADGRHC
jgi:PleD family two-component response regulator